MPGLVQISALPTSTISSQSSSAHHRHLPTTCPLEKTKQRETSAMMSPVRSPDTVTTNVSGSLHKQDPASPPDHLITQPMLTPDMICSTSEMVSTTKAGQIVGTIEIFLWFFFHFLLYNSLKLVDNLIIVRHNVLRQRNCNDSKLKQIVHHYI